MKRYILPIIALLGSWSLLGITAESQIAKSPKNTPIIEPASDHAGWQDDSFSTPMDEDRHQGIEDRDRNRSVLDRRVHLKESPLAVAGGSARSRIVAISQATNKGAVPSRRVSAQDLKSTQLPNLKHMANAQIDQSPKPAILPQNASQPALHESPVPPVNPGSIPQSGQAAAPSPAGASNAPKVPNGIQNGIQNTPQKVSEAVSTGVQVEDIIEPVESYRFSGLDRPDPFIAPVKLVEASKAHSIDSEEIPIISPLQYHDLKTLMVTGVWETERGKWKAMIETPDRQGIITKLQDAVGNSAGRVTEISPNGVLVREYRLRKDGSQEFNDRMIAMAKESDSGEKFMGGKIILSPGASAPEVLRPDLPGEDQSKKKAPITSQFGPVVGPQFGPQYGQQFGPYGGMPPQFSPVPAGLPVAQDNDGAPRGNLPVGIPAEYPPKPEVSPVDPGGPADSGNQGRTGGAL
ncbi:MAG: pilus assembly protein PilP [Proteobacteria bacterium]|nr:pilus assembly protein PilP [Pseudomonadota bacterium]